MKRYGRFIASGGAILLWSRCAIALGLICAEANGCGKVATQTQQFDRFADWCENQAQLSEAARHTVEVLLEKVETLDCQIADERLADLTELRLDVNRIADVGPLSGLTNLTELRLGGNQIVDVSPLSSLTNLTGLFLDENQISDVGPLSGLTNLGRLSLRSNPITDRTCPVEPQSICQFE